MVSNETIIDVMQNQSLNQTATAITGQDINLWDSILNGFFGLELSMQAVSIIVILLFALWLIWFTRAWIVRIADLAKYIAVALIVIIILIAVFSSETLRQLFNLGGSI